MFGWNKWLSEQISDALIEFTWERIGEWLVSPVDRWGCQVSMCLWVRACVLVCVWLRECVRVLVRKREKEERRVWCDLNNKVIILGSVAMSHPPACLKISECNYCFIISVLVNFLNRFLQIPFAKAFKLRDMRVQSIWAGMQPNIALSK